MKINGATVLVTGAGRGLGRRFAVGFAAAGAAKVYGTVRDPAVAEGADFEPVVLDIADESSIIHAAEQAADVTIVVNNAGINTWSPILGDPALLRRDMEINYFGTIAVTKAFAPILKANGGGYVVNILSTLSWITGPKFASYAGAKAALWSATNAMRLELLDQGTRVLAVHCGPLDTDMGSGVSTPKLSPEDVVAQTIEAIETDQHELLTDKMTTNVRERLSEPLTALYPALNQT